MVTLFSTKVETLIVTTPEAYQVSAEGVPTVAQQKNTHLVNFTCAFADHLRMAVARHTTAQQQKWESRKAGIEDPQAIVDQAIVTKLSGVCLSALEPLLKAIRDYIIDQNLPRMHKQIPAGYGDPPYVRDLQVY